MGAWGTGLYSNDTALDIRDTCGEVYECFPSEEAEKIIFHENKEIIESTVIDNDYASFWYGLADWQWNHGVLSEKVKEKTLELLETYTGLDEWESDGYHKAAQKRKEVLDKLRDKLKSPMPAKKTPKLRLKKPKHNPGDVLIIKATRPKDGWGGEWVEKRHWCWLIPNQSFPKQNDLLEPIDLNDKYFAILCIGKRGKRHSRYSELLFDEYSTYVLYDYVSDTKPTLDELKKVGFLPHGVDINRDGLIGEVFWAYSFDLCYWFSSDKAVASLEKIHDIAELERYNKLIEHHKKREKREGIDSYNLDSCISQGFPDSLKSFFATKKGFEMLHLKIDTLLEEDTPNPSLVSRIGQNISDILKTDSFT